VHTESVDARRGRAVHAYLEALGRGVPVAAALAAVPAAVLPWCRALDPAQVPQGDVEVAFAYDVATGQARRLDTAARRYSVTATEIPGTTDLVTWDSTAPKALDWKTARWDFDAQSARPQVDFYALCAARIMGADAAECAIGVIAEDGAIGWYRWELDWEDLAQIAERVRRTWERVQAARAERAAHEVTARAPWTPDVREGTHCRYCPAFLACPAKRAAVGALLGADVAQLDGVAAGAALRAGREVERLIEKVRSVVGDLVGRDGEVPAGEGYVIRRDGRGALRVLRARETEVSNGA
jgi:hypothetical protein